MGAGLLRAARASSVLGTVAGAASRASAPEDGDDAGASARVGTVGAVAVSALLMVVGHLEGRAVEVSALVTARPSSVVASAVRAACLVGLAGDAAR